MSAIKDGRCPILLDRERHLLFSLNVLDELQDKSGGYDQLKEFLFPDQKPNFKNLKWLLALLINEGAEENEPAITEKQLGKLIHAGNLNDVVGAIFKAFSRGSNGDETEESEADEDDTEDSEDEKNVTGEQ